MPFSLDSKLWSYYHFFPFLLSSPSHLCVLLSTANISREESYGDIDRNRMEMAVMLLNKETFNCKMNALKEVKKKKKNLFLDFHHFFLFAY